MTERFWPKVNKVGPTGTHRPDLGPCWVWTGMRTAKGYGRFKVSKKNVSTHRWAYEQLIGPIPAGLELDHLCRRRECVNPAHLEPKTHTENLNAPGNLLGLNGDNERRKTHCPRGHEYTEDNIYWENQGRTNKSRKCKTCVRARQARARQR